MDNMEWVPPKPRLQDGGVAIRPFRASDAAAVASACRDPDILRFTFMKDGLTEGEAGEWIHTGNERWPMGPLVSPSSMHTTIVSWGRWTEFQSSTREGRGPLLDICLRAWPRRCFSSTQPSH